MDATTRQKLLGQLEAAKQYLMGLLASLAAPKPVQSPTGAPTPTPRATRRLELYEVAAAVLGRRMGLDPHIPKEVNCANAITHIMKNAGVEGLPEKGIPGTATLYDWLRRRPDFELVEEALPGDILIYPTGMDDPSIPGRPTIPNGHVFVVGKYQLLSNNSATGLWDNHWGSLKIADAYYRQRGGLPRFIFRWMSPA